jgi:hypothetical protein
MNKTYGVEFNQDLLYKDDAYGQVSYREQKIFILPDTRQFPRSVEQIEHTYLHEIIHLILDEMNKKDLSKDEDFVDMFAGFLHQIIQTSRGDLLDKN